MLAQVRAQSPTVERVPNGHMAEALKCYMRCERIFATYVLGDECAANGPQGLSIRPTALTSCHMQAWLPERAMDSALWCVPLAQPEFANLS
jgi:hypothetical protein